MLKRILTLLVMALLAGPFLNAQVTTGTITGTVKDATGQNLNGATITAVHVPTGTKYVTAARSEGQFTLPNLRVGGPYTITVHYTGFGDQVFTDQNIALGTPLNISSVLTPSTTVMSDVVVTTSTRGVINPQRTGTSTNVSARQIQALPSINRNIQDFARLTPQARVGTGGNEGESRGISFAGQSNRYNQFSIDGANASDAFGLTSSGTNGGQANVNPISIDAIQEIQVVLSPYDVTQGGFTGGGINAITKSGTNKFHGSVYGQFQNQDFVGKSNKYNPSIIRQPYGDFKNKTFGASLGGPIIQNKLFFFVNAERFIKSTPLQFDPTQPGSGSKVNADTLKAIREHMLKTYGYDLGSYGSINNENESVSIFGRIDWNINDKHRLTFRHNYVDGSKDVRSRSNATPVFENTGYKFTDNNNSSVIELNSTFSSSASNTLRVTYNRVRDARISKKAPNLAIYNYDATSKATILYNLGSEYSSAANSLDQDVISVTDNFTLYKGNHTITFGTNNEFFKSNNIFLQGYYGAYTFGASGTTTTNNIANWMNNVAPTRYQISYSTAGRGDKAPAILKAAQLSAYAQDVWSASKSFKLTYGLRVDLPYISTQPPVNANFDSAFASFDVKTEQMPERKLMFSPRVGFNWNAEDEGVQVRGGFGLFTGRIPFVWISNNFSNTGVSTKSIDYSGSNITTNNIKYVFNNNDAQLGAFIPSTSAAAVTAINVIDKNFKFPQVFRANIAADKRLGKGFTTTFEVLYTKTVNNAYYTNLNLSENGESKVTLGSTTRPYWTKTVNPNYSQVLKLGNSSEGSSLNFTFQLQKAYSKGWSGSVSYNFGTATSLNDLPSSVALSNWRGVQSVNGLNKLDLGISNFDMGSRVSGYISKEFKYLSHFATTISLFYNGQAGQRLSYVYSTVSSKNITGEDNSSTSLVYIPASFSEANFADIKGGKTASQQWADFQAFAAANPYLKDHMGQNAERNGDRLPWENHFDARLAQDILYKTHKLQIFFDVVNVGALLNKKWGRAYGLGSDPDGLFPLTYSLFTPVIGSQTRDGVAIAPTATAPAFQFAINNATQVGNTYRPYNINNFTSRWSGQIGVRYSF